MHEEIHELYGLMQRLPMGYADQELIAGENGQAEDCVFLKVNPAFERMVGLPSESIVGKRASEVFAGQPCGADWAIRLKKAARKEENAEAELSGHRYKVLADTADQIHFAAIFQEQTPEPQLTGDLIHLQGLQAMFEEHAAAMLATDPASGRIIDANPAACAFYGYGREELKGMRMGEISPAFEEEIKKRHMEGWNRKHTYLLYPHRLKNGDVRMVDVYSSPIAYQDKAWCYLIIFDVTDREKYREDLYRRQELLGITLGSIGDGVVTTDRHGRITSLNKAAQEMTGWEEQEAQGKVFPEVFRLENEETGKPAVDPIAKVLRTGKTIGLANHTALIDRRGRTVPIADSAAPIRDKQGHIFGVVMVFRDVSRERGQQEQIRYMSYHDALTGLYNRRFAMEEIRRLDTPRQLPLAIIIGDVNGLKLTNDAFGHAKGDQLLKKVASALKASCRMEDIAVRWGGDEFLILLPKTTAETAKKMVQRMKDTFEQKSRGMMQVSVSLGYAVKDAAEEPLANALKEAEKWMYHKKLLEGKSYRSTIVNTLLATLNERSIETEEHSKRLENYCLTIGQHLRLSAEELNELSLLAMLHDIGKIGIPRYILQKPGPLSPEEWEEIKCHPEIGCRITKNIPELAMVSEYILLHHERWDGAGYPKGYRNTQIPLLCRILAVADAYDVMIQGRIYKAARSVAEALSELEQNAGTQFDPQIVELFTGIIRSGCQSFSGQALPMQFYREGAAL